MAASGSTHPPSSTHPELLNRQPALAAALANALAVARTQDGVSVRELSDRRALLVVLLRHFG